MRRGARMGSYRMEITDILASGEHSSGTGPAVARPGGTSGGRGRGGGGRGGDLRHVHTILRPITVRGAEATRQTKEVHMWTIVDACG